MRQQAHVSRSELTK